MKNRKISQDIFEKNKDIKNQIKELFSQCDNTSQTAEMHRLITGQVTKEKKLKNIEIENKCHHEWGDYKVQLRKNLFGYSDSYIKRCHICGIESSTKKKPKVKYNIERLKDLTT